jgi:hypothetical protein
VFSNSGRRFFVEKIFGIHRGPASTGQVFYPYLRLGPRMRNTGGYLIFFSGPEIYFAKIIRSLWIKIE